MRRISEKKGEMVVYNVDVPRIEKLFTSLEKCIRVLDQCEDSRVEEELVGFASERALHIFCEAIIDVGNLLIDGFILRDPGGYTDIIDILEDEGILTEVLSMEIKKMIQLRNHLVRDYTNIYFEELIPFIQKRECGLQFINSVRTYLEKELGERYETMVCR